MIIGTTQSVCPMCLRKIQAQKVAREDGIYLEKSCSLHGDFSVLIWEGDVDSYLAWDNRNTAVDTLVRPQSAEQGCPYDCGLCDNHLRKGCCMLLELTNKCNLKCPVCFAAAGDREPYDLAMAEIERQYDELMHHGGPFNIQLSGGEPTMRDDLPEIIRLGRSKGFTFFQLNTNGIRLAREPGYAAKLKEAGLDTVFLQFDGLSDDVYTVLRGRPLLELKMKAIDNCIAAGLGIVLVPVIAPDVNDHQIGDILRFALSRLPGVRGVHFQPISYFGRCGLERPKTPITIPKMLRLMEVQTGSQLKASDFTGGGAENSYCSFHASYRKRPDGSLKCLPRRTGDGCCCCTSDDSRKSVASQWTLEETTFAEGDMSETSALDDFLKMMHDSTFAVSGMLFQDAYTLDLDRLRRCHICEVDSKYGMVPFCAYNLTDSNGKSMYRT